MFACVAVPQLARPCRAEPDPARASRGVPHQSWPSLPHRSRRLRQGEGKAEAAVACRTTAARIRNIHTCDCTPWWCTKARGPAAVTTPRRPGKRKGDGEMLNQNRLNGNNETPAHGLPPPDASAGEPDELDNLLVFEGGQLRRGDPLG